MLRAARGLGRLGGAGLFGTGEAAVARSSAAQRRPGARSPGGEGQVRPGGDGRRPPGPGEEGGTQPLRGEGALTLLQLSPQDGLPNPRPAGRVAGAPRRGLSRSLPGAGTPLPCPRGPRA